MLKKLRVVTWVLLFVCYFMNMVAWGGLSLEPAFGDGVYKSAAVEAPLSALYIYTGRSIVQGMGIERQARDRAEAWFGDAYPAMSMRPAGALPLLFNEWSTTAKLNYYGFPALILVLLVLAALIPKPMRTFGG